MGEHPEAPDESPARAQRTTFRMLPPQAFLDLTADEVERAMRYGRPLSVAMLLIDRLLVIRKADGPEIAQEVMLGIGAVIRRSFRGPDKYGRLGPGELGVLMPETTRDQARVAAKRLRDAVAETPVKTSRGPRPVTLSIGIGSLSPRMRGPKPFLLAACLELRRARHSGSNQICVAPPDRVLTSLPRSRQLH